MLEVVGTKNHTVIKAFGGLVIFRAIAAGTLPTIARKYNLRPYSGNIFLVMFTEFFNIATMIFTAYVRDDSKTNVQNKESLPLCKKNRVRNILAIYPLD